MCCTRKEDPKRMTKKCVEICEVVNIHTGKIRYWLWQYTSESQAWGWYERGKFVDELNAWVSFCYDSCTLYRNVNKAVSYPFYGSANRRGMCVTTSRSVAGNVYCSTTEQRKLERILARIPSYSQCNILVHIIQEIYVSAGCVTILNTSGNPSAKRSMPLSEAQLQGAGGTIVFLNKGKGIFNAHR